MKQGFKKNASENHSLGRYIIPNIPEGPAGAYEFDVEFRIDENCLLKVKCSRRGQTLIEEEIKPEDHFALS